MRHIDETPNGTSLAETASINIEYVGLERSRSAVRLPEKSPKKTPPVDNFTHMGSRDPRPIIINFGLLGGLADVIDSVNICFDWLTGFVLRGAENGHSYT
jgi:hypothetical protein